MAGKDEWLSWVEPYAFLANFLSHDHGSFRANDIRFASSQTWTVWTANQLTAVAAKQNHVKDFQPEVKLALRLSVNSTPQEHAPRTTLEFLREAGLLFSMHMPPKSSAERNQPLSALQDGSVLLPKGHVYEVKARIVRYRRLNSKSRPCTSGLSMSSWQVLQHKFHGLISFPPMGALIFFVRLKLFLIDLML